MVDDEEARPKPGVALGVVPPLLAEVLLLLLVTETRLKEVLALDSENVRQRGWVKSAALPDAIWNLYRWRSERPLTLGTRYPLKKVITPSIAENAGLLMSEPAVSEWAVVVSRPELDILSWGLPAADPLPWGFMWIRLPSSSQYSVSTTTWSTSQSSSSSMWTCLGVAPP